MRILFADDDVKYATIIKRFLESEGYEVVYAGNGHIALELFYKQKPDLVLLDINMPGKNGFEVAQEIRKEDCKTLIFFLTDRSDKVDRLNGFKLKANDYLAKPFYPEELIARIKERFDDNASDNDNIFQFGQTTFDFPINEIRTHSKRVLITSRQADILRILAENFNRLVQRDVILKKIWGNDSYANSLTLNVQIALIRQALKIDNSIEIKTLPKKGYMLHLVNL